jgi:hypothetical protein
MGDLEYKVCYCKNIVHCRYELEQNVKDFGPNPEKDSNDRNPYENIIHEKAPHDVKPDIKGKMLRMQQPMRGN